MDADELAVESEPITVGLPSRYYTDPAVLAHELSTLFTQSWQIVGREENLDKPGDYLTCIIAGEPVVVLRDEDAQLRALHNVCSHRGMRLVDGTGNCKRLVCPYHSWTYGLTGQLLSVPLAKYLPTDFDKSEVQLSPLKVDTWGGFIFIHFDPGAASLATYLGTMTERWEAYHQDWVGLRLVRRILYHEPFNWKIFMENATDYYHIPFIHKGSLGLPPVYNNKPAGQHFMLTSSTPGEGYHRYFDLLFPNNYFHVAPNKIQHYRVLPEGPGESCIEVFLYQTPSQMDEYPIGDPTKHRDIDLIMEQDFSICRVLQEQTSSRSYHVRYTAYELEDGVNHFDRTVLAALS